MIVHDGLFGLIIFCYIINNLKDICIIITYHDI